MSANKRLLSLVFGLSAIVDGIGGGGGGGGTRSHMMGNSYEQKWY